VCIDVDEEEEHGGGAGVEEVEGGEEDEGGEVEEKEGVDVKDALDALNERSSSAVLMNPPPIEYTSVREQRGA
jgi:hypothetical protein